MDDLISRQAAIDAICSVCGMESDFHNCEWYQKDSKYQSCEEINSLRRLPSAQPERLTDDDFETIRIHLSACKEKLCNQHRWREAEEYQKIIDRFMSFVSAQPEIIYCKDCKHHWTHKCMDSMPIERCDLEQTFYDAEVDFCSLAERKEVTT